jgi:hypothetical protein
MPQEFRVIRNKGNDHEDKIIRINFKNSNNITSVQSTKDYKGLSFCQLMEEAQNLLQTITGGNVSQPIRIKTKSLISELKRRVHL